MLTEIMSNAPLNGAFLSLAREVDDDDVGLPVLGCRVDILGINCKKLFKVKWGVGVGGGESLWVRVIMSGDQQGACCWI